MKTVATMLRLTAVLTGVTVPAIAAVQATDDTNYVAVYIFLSFCALIVIGQLIPLITALFAAKKGEGKEAVGGPVPAGSTEGKMGDRSA